jgi:hypothetical protein
MVNNGFLRGDAAAAGLFRGTRGNFYENFSFSLAVQENRASVANPKFAVSWGNAASEFRIRHTGVVSD